MGGDVDDGWGRERGWGVNNLECAGSLSTSDPAGSWVVSPEDGEGSLRRAGGPLPVNKGLVRGNAEMNGARGVEQRKLTEEKMPGTTNLRIQGEEDFESR